MTLDPHEIGRRFEELVRHGARLELVDPAGAAPVAPVLLDDIVVARVYADGSIDIGFRPIGITADYGDGLFELRRPGFAHVTRAERYGRVLVLTEAWKGRMDVANAEVATRVLRLCPAQGDDDRAALSAWCALEARYPDSLRERSRDLHDVPWDEALWG